MRSLTEVLEQATAQNAYEVVIESGQPVVMTTPQGALALEGVFDENELIDALAGVLDPEQQVELAVGNLIEFQIQSDRGPWTLVTEPGAEGVMVRGRLQQAPAAPPPASQSGGFELPPLEPFSPDAEASGPAPGGSPRHAEPSAKPTVRELGFDAGLDLATAPTKTGEFDVGEGDANRTFYNPGGPAPMPGPASIDDLDLGGAPVLAGFSGPPELGVPADDDDSADGFSSPETRADPAAAAARPTRDDLETHALMIGPGTLCFVHAPGMGTDVAEAIGGVHHVIDDGPSGTKTMRTALDADEAAGTMIVRCEDPSRRLGWILRRLEEGWRVLVETRALTPEGARRILLGVDATAHADAWLSEQQILWMLPSADGWEIH